MNLQDERDLSGCRRNLFAFFSLAIVIFAIYSNTFHASWHFDDFVNLVDHPGMHLKSLEWSEIKETFFANRGKLNRPVSAFSLALNHYFSRTNVFSYHLVNTTIHCFSAIFLFLFILQTLKLPVLEKRYGPIAYSVALLASMLWAINPVQTQAVTYIIQRMASLAGLFYVLALYFYSRGRTAPSKSSRVLFLTLCTLSTLLAFGSKENTFVLPLSIFLYEIMLVRKATIREWFISNKRILITIVLAVTASRPDLPVLSTGGHLLSFLGGYQRRVFSLGQRLLTEPRVISSLPIPASLPAPPGYRLSTIWRFPVSPGTCICLISLCWHPRTVLGAVTYVRKTWPLTAFCVHLLLLSKSLDRVHHRAARVGVRASKLYSFNAFLCPISGLLITAAYAPAIEKNIARVLVLVLIAALVFFYGRFHLCLQLRLENRGNTLDGCGV